MVIIIIIIIIMVSKFNFFLVPQTSIHETRSTFYAEFRYVYRMFLPGRVSKIQRNLNV